MQRWLPVAKHFVRAEAVRHSIRIPNSHFWNPRLLAVFGMGFAALFCLVGTFTYANFYLAAPPYDLNSAQLGSIFFVYLLRPDCDAALRTMPRSLRDSRYRRRLFGFAAVGLLLTLVHSLPVIIVGWPGGASSGVFIYQAVERYKPAWWPARRARPLPDFT